jgi:hypothetical protein
MRSSQDPRRQWVVAQFAKQVEEAMRVFVDRHLEEDELQSMRHCDLEARALELAIAGFTPVAIPLLNANLLMQMSWEGIRQQEKQWLALERDAMAAVSAESESAADFEKQRVACEIQRMAAEDESAQTLRRRSSKPVKFIPAPGDVAGQLLRAHKDKHNEPEARRRLRRRLEQETAAAAAAAASSSSQGEPGWDSWENLGV